MSYFYQLFQNFVLWLLNPGNMIDSALSILLTINTFGGKLLPSAAQPYYTDAQAWINAGGAAKAVGIAAYLVSPFIDTTIFLAVMDGYILLWLVTSLISLAFMIKGWITGQGA